MSVEARHIPEKPRRKPSTLKRMILMIFAVLVLMAVIGGGFYLHIQKLIASAPKPTPATVSTMKVERTAWQPRIIAVGSLSAVNGVDLSSEVAGIVRAIPVKSGDRVQKGDEVLALNSAPAQAQLAALQATADLAAKVLERDEKQLRVNTVSQATVDADLANVRNTAALVEQQQALIAQKTVNAPFAGDLGIVKVNVGQYITPGQVIVTLQDLSALHVAFQVPQDQVRQVKVGQKVSVHTDAVPDKDFPGKVDAVNSKVDPETRNVTIQASLANPGDLLRPGMFVRVALDTGAPEQLLTLPQTAISYNSYGSTVFVVSSASGAEGADTGKDLTVKEVFVTTGPTRGDQVAITKGLKEGQVVVTSGQLKLKTGASVVINNKVQPANDPNPTPQEE